MDRFEKAMEIMTVIGITFFTIFLIALILIIIDFKNDYDCATTYDPEWYVEHNCMRYER